MRRLVFSALVSGIVSTCDKSDFYGKTAVVDLCDSHFPDKSSENVWMVEFYAPWCGHCQQLKPKYIEAAKEVKKDKESGIKFGAVDCTKEQNLCSKYGVKGYPTLKVFVGGKGKDYQGPREADAMIDFLKMAKEMKGTRGGSSKCSSPVIDSSRKEVVPLCSSHFPDKKSKNSWVILFTNGPVEKEAAKSIYVIASKITEGGVKFGIVDCDSAGKDFCESRLGEDAGTDFVFKTFSKGKTSLSTSAFTGGVKEAGQVIDFVKAELGSKFKIQVNDEL